MLNNKDIRLLKDTYFVLLRKTENFYEIQSKNTKHCWIVMKAPIENKKPVKLYHKHTLKTAYYHNHAETYTVEHAIKLIKGHDDYVLQQKR